MWSIFVIILSSGQQDKNGERMKRTLEDDIEKVLFCDHFRVTFRAL